MAKAGFRKIDNDTFKALMGAKLTGSDYQVLLVVIDRTLGFQREEYKISLSYFESETRLSRRGVIDAIKHVEGLNIITALRDSSHRKPTVYALNHPNLWLTSAVGFTSGQGNYSSLDKVTTVHQTSEVLTPTTTYFKETFREKLKERVTPPDEPLEELITHHPSGVTTKGNNRLKVGNDNLEAIVLRNVSSQDKDSQMGKPPFGQPPLSGTEIDNVTLVEKIVSYLENKGSLSPQELSTSLGVSLQSIRIRLSLAKKRGLVTNVERGKWALGDGQKPQDKKVRPKYREVQTPEACSFRR